MGSVFSPARRRDLKIFLGLFALGLLIGIIGIKFFQSLSWTDSLMNTCVMLSGTNPVTTPTTTGGKLFISGFSLFSGLFFIVVIVFVLDKALKNES